MGAHQLRAFPAVFDGSILVYLDTYVVLKTIMIPFLAALRVRL